MPTLNKAYLFIIYLFIYINNKQNKTGGHDIAESGGKTPEINQSESI
jgi:hypothetical protein